MLAGHALRGCDTIGAYFGIEKGTCIAESDEAEDLTPFGISWQESSSANMCVEARLAVTTHIIGSYKVWLCKRRGNQIPDPCHSTYKCTTRTGQHNTVHLSACASGSLCKSQGANATKQN